MNKSFLEMATEMTQAMVNKGYLRVPTDKNDSWEAFNRKAVKTVGWAILEMYREIENVPKRAKEPMKEKPKKPVILDPKVIEQRIR